MATKTKERPESRLRQERKRRRLSVRAVAEELGIDSSNLSRIELGDQMPTRKIARALFAFYGGEVSLAEIYDPMFWHEVGAGANR